MAKNNLKNATKKAQLQAKLNQLNNLGQSKDLFTTSLNAIEQVLGDFISRVQDNINKADLPVTGKIADIELVSKEREIQVLANEWLIYQDKGVSGTQVKYNTPFRYTDKMPPPDVFKDWIKRKNLNLRDNKKYYGKESPFKSLTQEEQIERTSWVIAKSVYKKGIKPKNIMTPELRTLEDELAEAVGESIVLNLVFDRESKELKITL